MNLMEAQRVLNGLGLSFRAKGTGANVYEITGVLTRHTSSGRGTTECGADTVIALAEDVQQAPAATGVRWNDDGSLTVE